MKKLMIAAVAMAAGALFAEDITSKNIVGYMNNNGTVKGLNLLGAGFQDVGYTSVKINSLKVTNKDGAKVTSGECTIQTIDSNGGGVEMYTWQSSGKGGKVWKWFDKSGVAVSDDVVFARGYGLLFTGENANDILASNGDVDLSACTNGNTIAGLNIIANPYPTTVKLNDLKVENKDGAKVTSGECTIQTIDSNGAGVEMYTWQSSGKGGKVWKWFDKSGTATSDDIVFNAGEAVLFTAESNGDKLIFPAK